MNKYITDHEMERKREREINGEEKEKYYY